MRAGYNPNRRNRNLGTKKAGHGQANRLVIPDCELWLQISSSRCRDLGAVSKEDFRPSLLEIMVFDQPKDGCGDLTSTFF